VYLRVEPDATWLARKCQNGGWASARRPAIAPFSAGIGYRTHMPGRRPGRFKYVTPKLSKLKVPFHTNGTSESGSFTDVPVTYC